MSKITSVDRLRIAAEALVDPSTVTRWASGQPVRSMTQARIERAIERLGIDSPASTSLSESAPMGDEK